MKENLSQLIFKQRQLIHQALEVCIRQQLKNHLSTMSLQQLEHLSQLGLLSHHLTFKLRHQSVLLSQSQRRHPKTMKFITRQLLLVVVQRMAVRYEYQCENFFDMQEVKKINLFNRIKIESLVVKMR